MNAVILFGSFFLMVAMTVPISVSLGLSSLFAMMVIFGIEQMPLVLIPSQIYAATDSYPLLAIPYFILAGNLMITGGVTDRLVAFFAAIVRGVPAGLAHVVTLSCMFFAALSGSSTATNAAIGKALVPKLYDYGYERSFSAGLVASSSVIGIIIPPSIAMIIYGTTAEVSIGRLFLGGFVPGIIIGLGIMGMSWWRMRKVPRPVNEPKFSWAEVWRTFHRSFWSLTIPFVVLGGIYAGIFTPTEAAAVAVFYGLFVGVIIHREIGVSHVFGALVDTVVDTANIVFLVAAASLFGWCLTYLQIPHAVAQLLLQITTTPVAFLLLVFCLYLVAGCFANPSAAIVIIVPILLPTVSQLGIDPIFFGVFTVMALSLGLITPPVGPDLFVTAGVTRLPFEVVTRGSMPFLGVMIVITAMMIFLPGLITWLPATLHG
ncbi:TRAP transporter large permease [Shumkonia mesophila]|uniref:TRAP transporter large permease n=1 Tax=Shumkonia mesophila TaxID=2838854 RepID=UPI002934FEDB|nr:TRAP transporter large permease [Shumkonia mesophila]